MKAQTLALIGLSRTSASVGLAVKKAASSMQVVGYDFDPLLARQAKEQVGALDKVEQNLSQAAAGADILLLDVPQQDVESVMEAVGVGLRPHALVLDISPLKARGLALAQTYLEHGHYVGVQPVLAAAHLADGRQDITLARAELFQNSVFCLMPGPQADPRAVETAVNFGRLLGATPYFLDPAEYDNLMQGIATLPGLLAAAAFNTLHTATGWRDILRFAGLPVGLMTAPLQNGAEIAELALHHHETTLRWLDSVIQDLQEFRNLIQANERDTLEATFVDLQIKREKWLRQRAENLWQDSGHNEISKHSLSEQMLGSWITRSRKDRS